MDKQTTLLNSILFNHLSPEEVLPIAELAQEHTFPAGSEIISENMTSRTLYVIKEGCVEIIKKLSADKEKPLLTLMTGECFGELSMFDDAPHSAIVRTTEETSLISVDKKDFEALMLKDPGLAVKILKKLLKILSFRLRQSNEQMLNVFAWDTDGQQIK